MPTLPVPAYRSAHLLPSILDGPKIDVIAARIREVVGRTLLLDAFVMVLRRLNSVIALLVLRRDRQSDTRSCEMPLTADSDYPRVASSDCN